MKPLGIATRLIWNSISPQNAAAKDAPTLYPRIHQHLQACARCREDYEQRRQGSKKISGQLFGKFIKGLTTPDELAEAVELAKG